MYHGNPTITKDINEPKTYSIYLDRPQFEKYIITNTFNDITLWGNFLQYQTRKLSWYPHSMKIIYTDKNENLDFLSSFKYDTGDKMIYIYLHTSNCRPELHFNKERKLLKIHFDIPNGVNKMIKFKFE